MKEERVVVSHLLIKRVGIARKLGGEEIGRAHPTSLREMAMAGYGRTAPPPAMGILFLEPRNAEKDRFRTHEGLVIRAWDAAADPLAPFVSRLRGDGSREGPQV